MSRQKNPRLKKANTPTEYTSDQVQELLKCANDPIYFINNYVYIRHPLQGQILFALYDYQEELIRNYMNNRYNIVLSARQTGKTETSCAYLLWFAIFNPDKIVFLVSNKSSNAMEMIGKIQNAYEELPLWLKPGIDDSSWNKHECKFDNKSRIISQTTSEDSGRGYAISLLYCDELAFVKNHIQEAFWDSILPTLACLKEDTLVLTSNGYYRIQDLFDGEEIGVLTENHNDLNLYTHNGMQEVSHNYISPASKVLKIKTSVGRELTVTPMHPLMKLYNDRVELTPAMDLVVGDYLRVDIGTEIFGSVNVDDDMAYMLGGYIAEGWYNSNSIWIANMDADFKKPYYDLGFMDCKSSPHKIYKGTREVVNKFFENDINPDLKCHNKIIPKRVLQFDKRSTCNFIAGLFDGDGSVNARSINYTSTSHQLVKEIQIMLNNLGMISIIYRNDAEKILKRERESGRILPHGKPLQSLRDSWGLNIPVSQYSKFKSLIPLKIKRKVKKLDDIILIRKQDDFKQFFIPKKPIYDTICAVFKESGKSDWWYRKVGGIRVTKMLDGGMDRKITYSLIGKWINIIEEYDLPVSDNNLSCLKSFLSPNIYWESIVSVEEEYCDKTYDFTVPNAGTFTQNGIMGSNTGGACIISSTPNGSVNLFARTWRKAEAGIGEFHPYYVPWDAPPGRDEKFRQDNIIALGKLKWEQEYECRFLSSDGTLIDTAILEKHDNRVDMLEPEFLIDEQVFWKKIHRDKTYVIGCDPATGSGADFSVIQVFEFPSLEQVMEYRNNTMNSNLLYIELKKIINLFETYGGEVYFSVENNGVGEGVISLYEADDNQPDSSFLSEPANGKLGFRTTNASKIKTCLKFKEMFENDQMVINSEMFLTEIKSFTRQSNTFKAEVGATDDCVSAFLIIIRVLEEMSLYDDGAFLKLYGFEEAEPYDPAEDDIDNNPMPFVF